MLEDYEESPFIVSGGNRTALYSFVAVAVLVVLILLTVFASSYMSGTAAPIASVLPSPIQSVVSQCNKFLGCFGDARANRSLEKQIPGDFSVRECYNAVKQADPNAAFYGLQYREDGDKDKGECWYGSGDYAKNGPATNCSDGPDGTLGGEWSSAVYDASCPWS